MKYLMLSKPLEDLSYPELADAVAHLGMDGVDLTVRSPGHVLPERVKTDCPRRRRPYAAVDWKSVG